MKQWPELQLQFSIDPQLCSGHHMKLFIWYSTIRSEHRPRRIWLKFEAPNDTQLSFKRTIFQQNLIILHGRRKASFYSISFSFKKIKLSSLQLHRVNKWNKVRSRHFNQCLELGRNSVNICCILFFLQPLSTDTNERWLICRSIY